VGTCKSAACMSRVPQRPFLLCARGLRSAKSSGDVLLLLLGEPPLLAAGGQSNLPTSSLLTLRCCRPAAQGGRRRHAKRHETGIGIGSLRCE
jgi:hypothetical protein